MTNRKKKLRIIQSILLFFGLLIIYTTYYDRENELEDKIISSSIEEKILQTKDDDSEKDLFFNVVYSGLDFNGNRYLLKSEEAFLDDLKPELVYMQTVNATFYFKDDTVLYIWADKGIYNNKTFDMKFENNVRAKYLDSELFAGKANFSNTKNYLTIYENVRVKDLQGNLIADKLLFDITKKKVEIASFNKGKVNANIKLK